MPPRVDSVALLERTMQMIRETHADWDEDQILECAFSVMNLQPNTNQAEKIPKSVLSIILQIVKLNKNNWAIWEPMFMDCIHPIKNARRILTGEIPSSHADYDKELDSHLLGLILSSCDHGSTSRIDTYTVREQDEEEQLGSTLYKKLKAALTINDKVKLSAIHDRVHEVKLTQHNIVNLGKELDQIWNNAARLGSHMDEKLKKSTLYRCAKDDWLYTQTVDVMGLNAQEAGGSLVSWAGMLGKQEGTSREHGRSAVSMETMDSYGFTCKGGAGPYARRGRQEEDQAQGACRWLPFRGSRDKSQRNHHRSKEEEQCIGDRQVGPEEEEQCRRSRHCSGGTGVPNKEEEQCRRSRHSSGGQEWC
ncbi:uncharacterized protein UDID_18410 [Ustilago sp. UG-2017a]|nr:uncharacterized protein UDID_18410 [Ustilago sp. UG-2017a]